LRRVELFELAEEALDAIALLRGLRRVRAALSVALWRDDEPRSALPSNRSFGTALIKKSSLASSGVRRLTSNM
jgi:hypothetical protein